MMLKLEGVPVQVIEVAPVQATNLLGVMDMIDLLGVVPLFNPVNCGVKLVVPDAASPVVVLLFVHVQDVIFGSTKFI